MLSSIGPQYDMPVSRPSCQRSPSQLQRLSRILGDHRRATIPDAFRFEAARAELLRELQRLARVRAAVFELRLHEERRSPCQVHEQLAAQVADAPCELEPFTAALAARGGIAAVGVRDREHRQIRQQHADEPVVAAPP